MNQDRGPLVNFALAAMGSYYRELGKQNLEQFSPIAASSKVPNGFNAARTNIDQQIQAKGSDPSSDQHAIELGYRLFEGRISQPQRILYACSYGTAIETVKFFQDVTEQLSPYKELVDQIKQAIDDQRNYHAARYLTTPEKIASWGEDGKLKLGLAFTFLRDLQEAANRVNQVTDLIPIEEPLNQARGAAELSVGMLKAGEERAQTQDSITLSSGIESFSRKLRAQFDGSYFGMNEAMETRDAVEEYFSQPQKAARIHFLSGS